MTSIEWTQAPGFKGETWNPVTGCSHVSPGCEHCYAEAISHRFKRTVLPWGVSVRGGVDERGCYSVASC